MNYEQLIDKIDRDVHRGKIKMKIIVFTAILLIGILLFLALPGCEELKQAIADPNNPTVIAVENTAEGAVGLTQALGALWPALIPIGTAAGGILAAYKRLKPKIIESQKQGDAYYAAGETLASVLEDIKTHQPDLWVEIGPRIEKVTKSASEIENTIRGFRHLPPKKGSLV